MRTCACVHMCMRTNACIHSIHVLRSTYIHTHAHAGTTRRGCSCSSRCCTRASRRRVYVPCTCGRLHAHVHMHRVRLARQVAAADVHVFFGAPTAPPAPHSSVGAWLVSELESSLKAGLTLWITLAHNSLIFLASVYCLAYASVVRPLYIDCTVTVQAAYAQSASSQWVL